MKEKNCGWKKNEQKSGKLLSATDLNREKPNLSILSSFKEENGIKHKY